MYVGVTCIGELDGLEWVQSHDLVAALFICPSKLQGKTISILVTLFCKNKVSNNNIYNVRIHATVKQDKNFE